jgi:leader peptidase (prepilin peptidase)/N-methyltransferase
MMTVGLLFNYFPSLGLTSFSNALTGAIVGFTFLWGLNVIYHWAKKQHEIGMGDVNLLAPLGASTLPELLLIASIGGLIGGLFWLRFQKQYSYGLSFWTISCYCWHH